MRGDQHGMAGGQSFDQLAHGPDLPRIQPDGGFIQNNELRLVHERVREADALAVTFGKMPDDFAAHVFSPHCSVTISTRSFDRFGRAL